MTLFIDQLAKARQIWVLLVNIPVEDADLLRWVAISGLPDFEGACLQAHSHVRASGRLPNNLNRWIKAYLYGKKAERLRREKSQEVA